MHTSSLRWTACYGGQLWVLGDPQQAPSVKAGGIAADLERRMRRRRDHPGGAADRQPAPGRPGRPGTLSHILRCGDAADSQRLRPPTAGNTPPPVPAAPGGDGRRGAGDILAIGAGSTIALVVSHAQAEDLTDRIRRRLTDTGTLSGRRSPVPDGRPTGPIRPVTGSCSTPATATVTANSSTAPSPPSRPSTTGGLVIQPDRGETPTTASGLRPRGPGATDHRTCRTPGPAPSTAPKAAPGITPTSSAPPSLDAYRGYTGQSRSVTPPTPGIPPPSTMAITGDGSPTDAAAPNRSPLPSPACPDTTMAAADDPWRTDHHLRTVIGIHQAVLDCQPRDRTAELAGARSALTAARHRLTAAEAAVAAATAQLDRLGPFAGVTRAGRASRHHLETDMDNGHAAIIDAAGAVAAAQDHVERLDRDQAAHDTFQRDEAWRRHAIATARDRLDAHWSDVALACAHADQPLAYGPDPLRLAHHRLSGQLAALDATVPADRQPALEAAHRDMSAAITAHRAAAAELIAARDDHAELARRRWPRRDPAAIGRAADRCTGRETDTRPCRRHRDRRSRAPHALDDHQHGRRRALHASAPERRRLTVDIELVADALDRTRPARVLDLARQPSPWQVELLGPVPNSTAGHAVWCHAAHQLETHLDYRGDSGPAWDRLCRRPRRHTRAVRHSRALPLPRPVGHPAARMGSGRRRGPRHRPATPPGATRARPPGDRRGTDLGLDL